MGVFNYNRLLNLDLGYIKYSLTPIARYFRLILTTVRKSLKGILKTKGRD